MKSSLLYTHFFLFGTMMFSSCENSTVTTGDGSEKIVLTGKVTSETREVKPFKAIRMEGVFNVILDQGDVEALKVETDENLQKVVLVEINKDTLVLKMKEDVSIDKMKKIDIHLTVVNLSNIEMASVGSLKCAARLTLPFLDVKTSGVGTTNLNILGENLNVRSEIVGALILSGEINKVVINHSGVGSVNAFDLKTRSMDLTVDGIGGAEVYASNEISIKASGVGNVRYKGGAPKKDIRAEGVGKVEEVN